MPCGVRRGGVPEAEPYRTADALDRAVDLAKLRKGGFRDPSKTGAIPENDGLPELFERDIGFYQVKSRPLKQFGNVLGISFRYTSDGPMSPIRGDVKKKVFSILRGGQAVLCLASSPISGWRSSSSRVLQTSHSW